MIGEIQSSRIDLVAEIVEGGGQQVLDDGHQHVWEVGANEHLFLEPGPLRLAGAGLLVRFLDLALDVGEDLLELFDAEGAALNDVLEALEGLEVWVLRLRLGALVGWAAEAAKAAAVVFEKRAGGGDHDEGEGGGVEIADLLKV